MPGLRTAAVVALAGILTLPASGQDAPQQPPVFRAGVETVPIYATVLDRFGETVRNLTREDFEVYDDGALQNLTVFEAGLQPITAVVMVDTSASMTLNLSLAVLAAEQFVIRLLPDDRARVGSFSDRIDVSTDFTGNRDELLRALREDLHIGNPTKLWEAVDTTIEALAPLGGRRVLMLMTDGMDTASDTLAAGVLARARISEVMVYVVQFRSSPLANLAEFPATRSAGDLLAGSNERTARSSPGQLRQLARQSGGGFFVLGQFDNVNATFTHMLQELHYQYVLGFTPQRADGRPHTLDVRVGDEDLIVRARQSYLAASPPAVDP